MSRKSSGRDAEDAAARHLRSRGYKILERNYATVLGEIDIVALDGEVVCFVEVRSRTAEEFGSALELLTVAKQRRVTRAALAYMKAKRLEGAEVRFDFAAVEPQADGQYRVTLIENAFWPEEVRRGT